MFRPSAKRTTPSRAFWALAFAFAFPPVAFMLIGIATSGWSVLVQAPQTLSMLLVVGLLFGWPFILVGGVIWVLLEWLRRHYLWCAVLVGAIDGGVLGALLSSFGEDGTGEMAMRVAVTTVGAATGLGVWLIAYGGRERPPIITRPPLVL
ncbi:MAG: hypothetical protein J7515_16900 [Caulobacter sp.]|nr:hypothetical protein [Caulobacter sp.]